MRLSIAWPKLLGTLLLVESGGIILLQASSWSGRFRSASAGDWCGFVVAILFFFASYFLFCGRNWARLTVIAIGTCSAAIIIWFRVASSITTWRMFSPETGRHPFQIWQSVADDVGFGLVFFLTPLAFIVCTLCHRDVVATFRPETDK
jgi:hypothetical protein